MLKESVFMNKKALKVISMGATVVGAIVSVAGAIAGTKLQDLELAEKVAEAVEKLKVD